MKRNRLSSRKRLSPEAKQLIYLSTAVIESGGRLEELFFERQIAALIEKLFQEDAEDDLTAALDHLLDTNPIAHGDLACAIEEMAEACTTTHQGQAQNIMLFTIPILAWSRFAIPSGAISASRLQAIKKELSAHVFASNANISLQNYLFSPDQLPRSYVETWKLMGELGKAALTKKAPKFDISNLPETNPFLSDTRYLIGALAVPHGAPLFRWNESALCTRESALKDWTKHGSPCFEPLLTGCEFKLLLADSYHAGCRIADVGSRPYSLLAAISFLRASLGISADALRVVIGGFYDKELEEYRVGFGPKDSEAIFHGLVWPLLDSESEAHEGMTEIETLLRELGVNEIVSHNQQFPLEFCDDCGAPLYPDNEGELVHPELPEPGSASHQTLH